MIFSTDLFTVYKNKRLTIASTLFTGNLFVNILLNINKLAYRYADYRYAGVQMKNW